MSTLHDSARRADRTRDCLDPWTMSLVKADGTVCLCCWSRSVGRIDEEPLRAILGGARAREQRRRLLEGDPGEDCLRCPARAWTTPTRLRERVQATKSAEHELRQWKAHAKTLEGQRDELRRALQRSEAILCAEVRRLEHELQSGPVGLWRRSTAPLKRMLRWIGEWRLDRPDVGRREHRPEPGAGAPLVAAPAASSFPHGLRSERHVTRAGAPCGRDMHMPM